MAIYWPEQRVALDIIDDPYAQHVDKILFGDWDILELTCAEIHDFEGMHTALDTLCLMLGQEPPEKTPEWLAANEQLFYSLRDTLVSPYYGWLD